MPMKTLITASLFLLSLSSFAQDYGGSYDVQAAFVEELKAHDESPVIKAQIAEVEAKYQVKCDGFTTVDYPYVFGRMTYRAKCISETAKLKLVIKSKYNKSLQFKLKKVVIKVRK